MSYTTSTLVQAEFKSIVFSTTTLVALADVVQFIVEADALINSFVGMKYEVPVTAGTDALELLKLFSNTLVADRIKKIMEVKQSAQNTSANQDVRGAYSSRDVMKQLEAIKKGDLLLSGATPLVSAGGLFSQTESDDRCRTFHKDCRDW